MFLTNISAEQKICYIAWVEVGNFSNNCAVALENLNFNEKKVIVSGIINKVIATQKDVQVYGAFGLNEIYVKLFTEDRHRQDATRPHYPITNTNFPSIPFEFTVQLPPPRKQRLIIQRDFLGRIENSVPPPA